MRVSSRIESSGGGMEWGGRNPRAEFSSPLRIVTGVVLAALILIAWSAAVVFGLVFYGWGAHSVVSAPVLATAICWLYVGLFIVSHDCMHGSLLPGKPRLNRLVGQCFLSLYAGFSFDKLRRQHFLHHRHSGTQDDPDFDDRLPHSAPRWYLSFLIRYFSGYQLVLMGLVSIFLLGVVGVDLINMLVFWALPAILSSIQLFIFGIYLPHRSSAQPFADRHRTRDSGYGWWRSLLTCYHFGHHQTHHELPRVPWWGLPMMDKAKRSRPYCGGLLENTA